MKDTFTSFDRRMFNKAKEVAETSTYKLHSLGCILVYKKKIISSAANSAKSHPVQKKYNRRYRKFTKTAKPVHDGGHAEILALSRVPHPTEQEIDWSKVRVYIYRISPGHKSGIGMARPCPACFAALKDKGIRHIYYTGDNSYIYEEII